MYKEARTEAVQVRLSVQERKHLESVALRQNTTLPLAMRKIFLEGLEKMKQELANERL